MSVKHALGIGFGEFMDAASEGWSLVAVHASIERTAIAMRRRHGISEYVSGVSPVALVGNPLLCRETKRRRCFVLKLEDNPWTVILRTVDWIRPEDAVGARQLAEELSRSLRCVTMSSIGAYDGAECRRFENGQELCRVDSDDPSQDFLEFCDEQQLSLPGCFIGFEEADRDATLYIENLPLNYVERVDRFVCSV